MDSEKFIEAYKFLEELLEGVSDHTIECDSGIDSELSRKMKEIQIWLIKNDLKEKT